MMPISFENIISEPHDMAGVGLEPDVYPMDELTPEKLITEKTGDGPAAGNTGIDSFTNLSFLSMRLDPSCWTPETWCMISAACFFYLTGWIKSAPTYNYPCWIVVALIFTVQRCLICVIVIGSRNCVLS